MVSGEEERVLPNDLCEIPMLIGLTSQILSAAVSLLASGLDSLRGQSRNVPVLF